MSPPTKERTMNYAASHQLFLEAPHEEGEGDYRQYLTIDAATRHLLDPYVIDQMPHSLPCMGVTFPAATLLSGTPTVVDGAFRLVYRASRQVLGLPPAQGMFGPVDRYDIVVLCRVFRRVYGGAGPAYAFGVAWTCDDVLTGHEQCNDAPDGPVLMIDDNRRTQITARDKNEEKYS